VTPTGDAAFVGAGVITGGLSIANQPAASQDGNTWVVVN
jgi:2-oxoglutarate dehydrogenase complex dehydrogenase (E1) component-like enzyme